MPASDHRQIDELSGPVKSLRFETLVFDTYTGKMDTERMPQDGVYYDENGDLIEEKSYTSGIDDPPSAAHRRANSPAQVEHGSSSGIGSSIQGASFFFFARYSTLGSVGVAPH